MASPCRLALHIRSDGNNNHGRLIPWFDERARARRVSVPVPFQHRAHRRAPSFPKAFAWVSELRPLRPNYAHRRIASRMCMYSRCARGIASALAADPSRHLLSKRPVTRRHVCADAPRAVAAAECAARRRDGKPTPGPRRCSGRGCTRGRTARGVRTGARAVAGGAQWQPLLLYINRCSLYGTEAKIQGPGGSFGRSHSSGGSSAGRTPPW